MFQRVLKTQSVNPTEQQYTGSLAQWIRELERLSEQITMQVSVYFAYLMVSASQHVQ